MPDRAMARMMGSHTGQESGMDHPDDTDLAVLGLGPGGGYVAGTLATLRNMSCAYPTFSLAIKDAPHNLDLS